MKIAYAGIDLLYPALEALVNMECELIGIYTCRTDNVTEFNVRVSRLAGERNIPCSFERIGPQEIEELKRKGCELFVCAGYYYKIPVDRKLRMVNIHPSFLPAGRGAWPMAVSILRRRREGGVTLHKMTERFDEGDILLQEAFPLVAMETHETYMEKVYERLPAMLKKLIAQTEELWTHARPQAAGEYWKTPGPDDYTVTSEMSVEEADLILRAFYGYECIYRRMDTKKEQDLVMIRGRAVKRESRPDEILRLQDGVIEAAYVRQLEATGKENDRQIKEMCENADKRDQTQ